MAKREDSAHTSATVDRVYGVVPRPRSFDNPAAWVHKAKDWRTYYGYRYRPEAPVPEAGKRGDKFSDAAIAEAVVAHAELGGAKVPVTPTVAQYAKMADASMAAAIANAPRVKAREAAKPTPQDRLWHHVTGAIERGEKTPIVEVPPEVELEPELIAAEPIAAPVSTDRFALVAEVLRELAGKYGPRRAHKLLAMADFVLAAA